jgi:hypothetical protein
MEGLTFGCDPEVFIIDQDGEFVSPDGIIPGTKEEPYPVKKGAVQQDGMAAEFNIEPVTNFKDFSANIKTVMKEMEGFLPRGYSFSVVPSATFSEKVWEEASEKAKTLGCSPDFNAWTGSPNPPPEDLENPRLRCAGGHLHFGWTDNADMTDIQHITNCRDLVKQLEWFLGPWSVRLDKDPLRRRLYGASGSMRFKPYGVEWRTLSNFWLTNGKRLKETWNRMQSAIWAMRHDFMPGIAAEGGFNDALIESINTSTRNKLLEKKFYFPVMNCGE